MALLPLIERKPLVAVSNHQRERMAVPYQLNQLLLDLGDPGSEAIRVNPEVLHLFHGHNQGDLGLWVECGRYVGLDRKEYSSRRNCRDWAACVGWYRPRARDTRGN